MTGAAVSLAPGGESCPDAAAAMDSAGTVEMFGTDVPATLGWAVSVSRQLPSVGTGATRTVWEVLASVASVDVSAARILEPHLDALSILHQAGTDLIRRQDPWNLAQVGADSDSSWGVYAAESADARLEAHSEEGGWVLRGTKPWCSLAEHVSHALVTAFVDDTRRQLFAVDMRNSGIRPHRDEWFARGLPHVVSSAVDFSDVPAVSVGDEGWYLTRPGFSWGGMSVAACWWGAAHGVAQALRDPAASPRADQVALVHLGRADAPLWAARAVLAEAAEMVDGRVASEGDERLLAARVRAVVADAATLVLSEADAALGPAPLVTDPAHARRVSDLHLYLRQHHGLRDSARIGRLLASNEGAR